ncbi:unnamed protein product [Caenorhabditis bovis]|uniref:ZP domain-containing protein n=1 Tax=Caenorhabditis bovis TaxID=2654633 RepID=A0A8S1ECS1_9PELO|nr:unnamed protein product [Caenorhabditis bovis]
MLQLFLIIVGFAQASSDFDNARVIGLPQIQCSQKSISLNFETNIPFQGRISVLKKLYIPECNQDYSSNISKNATFYLDITKCADVTFLKNGSRILKAHVEIGFHPLVITNNDRIFSVECTDPTTSQVVNVASSTANCTHLVRMASRWESTTEFHVGDAIVHEWNCRLPNKELGKTQTFITNCNALSQNGQVIHLIDENGCIIDSELMGEVVYSKYMPKLYARAKIFKLPTDDKYRIECTVEFCHRDSPCKERSFPPKCAFTKEEIIRRFSSPNNDIEQMNGMIPGNTNIGYDQKIKISTAWLTVKYNQYTSIESLHERYRLKTTMNPTFVAEKLTTPSNHHFLMGISYREPQSQRLEEEKRKIDANRIEAARILHPSGFKPVLGPAIDSDEDFIESITIGSNNVGTFEKLNIAKHLDYKLFSNPTSTLYPIKPYTSTTVKVETIPTPGVSTTISPTDITIQKTTKQVINAEMGHREKINGAETVHQEENVTNIITSTNSSLVKFPSTKYPRPAQLKFYTDVSTKKLTPTTPYTVKGSTVPPRPKIENVLKNMNAIKTQQHSSRKTYEKFISNNADWRLDDRGINDSDIFPEKQSSAACSNATIISTQQACKWSGIEHLLLIWSFASLIVWMIMIAVCLYRHSNRKPGWMAFREQELRRATQSRVLSQDHPWIHSDAFEERVRSKNEIEINKF